MRVPGTAKAFRGALTGIAKQKLTPHDAFASDNPLFSMALNPTAQRRQTNREFTKQKKPPARPTGWDPLAGYMSDSSDDES